MSIPRFTIVALIAAALAAVAIAAWPASETDKARDNGEQFGEAVVQLSEADSSAEVDAALAEIDAAVADTRENAGDEVAEQVAAQEDALARAVDGFVGANSTDDAWEADLYEAELEIALDDLSSQASDFRAQGPEVQEAFWEGYEDGLSS
jgi:hypothetical protein